MKLDERAWKELAAATKKWLADVQRIEEAAEKRIERSGDPHQTMDVGLVIMLFEALPFTTARAAEGDAVAGTRRTRARRRLSERV